MKYIIPIILFLLFCTSQQSRNVPIYRTNLFPQSIKITPENINLIEPEIVLAAIAWHEAGQWSQPERWLIMEATYNRWKYDFNCNGANFRDQLLAPKQFPKIFKNLFFDNTNLYHIQNYIMASRIIGGEILSKSRRLYYWGCSIDKHYKFCRRHFYLNPDINRFTTINKFA